MTRAEQRALTQRKRAERARKAEARLMTLRLRAYVAAGILPVSKAARLAALPTHTERAAFRSAAEPDREGLRLVGALFSDPEPGLP